MSESALELTLPDEAATLQLGQRLARALSAASLPQPFIVYLKGPLGAGKTALARSLLRALGVTSTIRSPTYTLLEIYETGGITCAHLDLYRLAAPGELEQLGLRDLLEPGHLWLVEWPDKGQGMLPPPDLTVDLAFEAEGRTVGFSPASPAGTALIAKLSRPS
jgi:tRNA threonylcarbamoyladenosine biosynthesis protein TsaE